MFPGPGTTCGGDASEPHGQQACVGSGHPGGARDTAPSGQEERAQGDRMAVVRTWDVAPGGGQVVAVAWGDGAWALSELGYAVPCSATSSGR